MDAALRLRLGDALDAVDAALVFQCAIDFFARDLADDFLVTARGAFADVGHLAFPAFAFEVLGVHAEQVAGENGGFIAARAAADFEDGVLAVLRVGRDEQDADLLFHLRQFLFQGGGFFLGHLAEVFVFLVQEDVLGVGQVADHLAVAVAGHDDGFEFLVVLVELHVALHVGDDLGITELGTDAVVFRLESVQFFEQIVFCHDLRVWAANLIIF